MSAGGEVASLDSGPLEKSHMRDMIQRNAIQDMAYGRFTKRLESQKKAFVRQNTRDEEEMKTLLCRLQTEQQLPTLEDADVFCDDDDDTLSDGDESRDDAGDYGAQIDETANPYPITIMPKFSSNIPKRTGSNRSINIPDMSKYSSRGKSDDISEVQESMSALSMSPPAGSYGNGQSGSVVNLSRDETIGDWLASPDAISSVRRARKTVSEQANRKNIMRSSSEYISQQDLANVNNLSQSPRGNIRSNSLKDRRKASTSKESLLGCRRGSSLKEKKTELTSSSETRKKQLSRSVSMLTRTTLAEFNMRQEIKARKYSFEQRDGPSDENMGDRPSDKKERKQSVSRKSSNEAETDDRKSSKRPSSFKIQNTTQNKVQAIKYGK